MPEDVHQNIRYFVIECQAITYLPIFLILSLKWQNYESIIALIIFTNRQKDRQDDIIKAILELLVYFLIQFTPLSDSTENLLFYEVDKINKNYSGGDGLANEILSVAGDMLSKLSSRCRYS